MTFVFTEKTETLNWDMISQTDVNQIIQTTDVAYLETMLQNITNAQLKREDLKRFGDKNLIKLFKVGQLTLEYLLFAQNHSEQVLQGAQAQYKQAYDRSVKLEDKAKQSQKSIAEMKSDLRVKKQTLKTYETILKQPRGLPVEVFKCKVCFKFFATNSYLITHYKRRHTEYYEKEIRQKEKELLDKELGEIDKKAAISAQHDDFFVKVKEEVVDKYSSNFVDLQGQLHTIKKQNQEFQMNQHQKSNQIQDTLTDTNFTVKQYQQLIEEFKSEVGDKIVNQKDEVNKEVKGALDKFLAEEKEQERVKAEAAEQERLKVLQDKQREKDQRNAIKKEVEQDITITFEKKFEVLYKRLEDRDRKINQLQSSQATTEHSATRKEKEMESMKKSFDKTNNDQENTFKKLLEQEAAKQDKRWQSQLSDAQIQEAKKLKALELKYTILDKNRENDQKQIQDLLKKGEQLEKQQAEEAKRQAEEFKKKEAEMTKQYELEKQELENKLKQQKIDEEILRSKQEKLRIEQEARELAKKELLEEKKRQEEAVARKRQLEKEAAAKAHQEKMRQIAEQKEKEERAKAEAAAKKKAQSRSGPLEDDNDEDEKSVESLSPQKPTEKHPKLPKDKRSSDEKKRDRSTSASMSARQRRLEVIQEEVFEPENTFEASQMLIGGDAKGAGALGKTASHSFLDEKYKDQTILTHFQHSKEEYAKMKKQIKTATNEMAEVRSPSKKKVDLEKDPVDATTQQILDSAKKDLLESAKKNPDEAKVRDTQIEYVKSKKK